MEFETNFFNKKTSFLKRSRSHLSKKQKINEKYPISKKICPSKKTYFCEKLHFRFDHSLTENSDFHGNSTDIEFKTPLEHHYFRSEMISLRFLNAKTTSPLIQRLSTHSFGYCFFQIWSQLRVGLTWPGETPLSV